MSNWYQRIEDDLVLIPDFIDYYNKELFSARSDVKLKGKIELNSSDISTVVEIRFNQLQDIEAVLEYLNIELRKIKFKHLKAYTLQYNGARALTDRQLEKFALGEPEVTDMEVLVNKVALVRNQFLGIIKGLEVKHFQISNLVKMRCAGLDDATI
jgi:hypothetical protein